MSSPNNSSANGVVKPAPVTHGGYNPSQFSGGPRGREVSIQARHLPTAFGIDNLNLPPGTNEMVRMTNKRIH